jgi:bifunctional ADP-heptose synthase (sugar kinase/adenylyltransferase)
MKRVLVLGDSIRDIYRHFTATRLCPEGPVPVLVEDGGWDCRAGGADLVAHQLTELFEDPSVPILCTGSYSEKERLMADDRLMLRIDRDSVGISNPELYLASIETQLRETKFDAIIVSDYDKGAFEEPLANWLVRRADDFNTPVFVDAKKNWHWYRGSFTMFPNDRENSAGINKYARHIIHKLGPGGCKVDGVHIPTKNHAVRDVTGAGDVFLAAFVYKMIELGLPGNSSVLLPEQPILEIAARFANKVAGISVEYVGTHCVTKEELDKHSD